jgi:hypothetical protein
MSLAQRIVVLDGNWTDEEKQALAAAIETGINARWFHLPRDDTRTISEFRADDEDAQWNDARAFYRDTILGSP